MPSHERKIYKKNGTWTVDGRPRDSFKLLSHDHPVPGKSQITLLITIPPGGAAPPHRHNGASATGLMLRGTSLQQMNCDEPKVYKEGDHWYEAPGCHHVRSENMSETEECSFYAVMMADDEMLEREGYAGLVVVDAEVEEREREKEEKEKEREKGGKGEHHETSAGKGDHHETSAGKGDHHETSAGKGDHHQTPAANGDHHQTSVGK